MIFSAHLFVAEHLLSDATMYLRPEPSPASVIWTYVLLAMIGVALIWTTVILIRYEKEILGGIFFWCSLAYSIFATSVISNHCHYWIINHLAIFSCVLGAVGFALIHAFSRRDLGSALLFSGAYWLFMFILLPSEVREQFLGYVPTIVFALLVYLAINLDDWLVATEPKESVAVYQEIAQEEPLVRLWEPEGLEGLAVPWPGQEQRMTQGLYERLLERRLEELIEADPTEAKWVLEISDHNPSLQEVAQGGTDPRGWAANIMVCDQLHMRLNQIDFQKGQTVWLPREEFPTLLMFAEDL